VRRYPENKSINRYPAEEKTSYIQAELFTSNKLSKADRQNRES
jgi:hypothetical protein